nr:MAG TPA: hypothetical protein [Caudoviricetes sp.]
MKNNRNFGLQRGLRIRCPSPGSRMKKGNPEGSPKDAEQR